MPRIFSNPGKYIVMWHCEIVLVTIALCLVSHLSFDKTKTIETSRKQTTNLKEGAVRLKSIPNKLHRSPFSEIDISHENNILQINSFYKYHLPLSFYTFWNTKLFAYAIINSIS